MKHFLVPLFGIGVLEVTIGISMEAKEKHRLILGANYKPDV